MLGRRRFASDSPDMASRNGAATSPVWDKWRHITRFLESARLAFARERNLWTSLEIESAEAVKLSAPTGQGAYRVSLHKHLAAVQDEDTREGLLIFGRNERTFSAVSLPERDRMGPSEETLRESVTLRPTQPASALALAWIRS